MINKNKKISNKTYKSNNLSIAPEFQEFVNSYGSTVFKEKQQLQQQRSKMKSRHLLLERNKRRTHKGSAEDNTCVGHVLITCIMVYR